MGALSTPLALFLALVLAAAAGHKLLAADRLSAAAARLLRVPLGAARRLSFAAATVEASAVLALLVPASRPFGAVAAVSLWLLYAALLGAAARRGEGALDCGCSFGRHRGNGGFERRRALTLALLAAGVAAMPAAPLAVEPVFAAFALFGLYLAAGELAALPPLRGSLSS